MLLEWRLHTGLSQQENAAQDVDDEDFYELLVAMFGGRPLEQSFRSGGGVLLY